MVATSAPARACGAWSKLSTRERFAAGCLAILCLLLLVSRAAGLGVSLWNDEVAAVVQFVQPGPEGIWGRYSTNNHVLFSLLAWATTLALGTGESAVRLWSVVPGIVAVVVLSLWTWRRLGPGVAVVVALLGTTAPRLLQLHAEARGYGLTTLAAVLLLVTGDWLLRSERDWRRWLAYGGAAVLGIWTHVAFAIGYVAQSLSLFVVNRLRRGLLISAAAVIVTSAGFYAPHLAEMASTLPRDFGGLEPARGAALHAALDLPAPTAKGGGAVGGWPVEDPYRPLPWHAPVTGPLTLVAPGVELLLTGRVRPCSQHCYEGPNFVYLLPLLALGVAGAAELWRRGRRELVLLLVAPPVLTYFLLTVPQGFVADRFASYTIPHTIVVVATGVVGLGHALWRLRFARPVVVAGAAAVTALLLVQFDNLVDRHTVVPLENPRRVAMVVGGRGSGPVFTNSTRPLIFFYYLGRDRVRPQAPAQLQETLCRARAPFAFVYHRYRSPQVDLRCLERRSHRRVRVPQRARGRWIDVYLVEGKTPQLP